MFILLSHWFIGLDIISCHVIAPIPSSAILSTLLSVPVTLVSWVPREYWVTSCLMIFDLLLFSFDDALP